MVRNCTARCCSTPGSPVWMTDAVLLQLELLRRNEQVQCYSQSSRLGMCVAQGCVTSRGVPRSIMCICVSLQLKL
jgi:hypothetical protein